MARDWVKMRTELYRDPKVVLMANVVAQRLAASSCNVTRNVTRNAVVGALVTVWGILRHNGRRTDDDLVIAKGDLQMIDDISELPGMGEAMQEVEWVIRTEAGLRFPAFFSENNVDPNEDKAAKNAERQRRYRESKAKSKSGTDEENDVTRNATRNVTGNDRAEESREEKSRVVVIPERARPPQATPQTQEPEQPQPPATPRAVIQRSSFRRPTAQDVAEYATGMCMEMDAQAFCDHYAANGWRIGRNAMKDWKAAARNWAKRDRDYAAAVNAGMQAQGSALSTFKRETPFERNQRNEQQQLQLLADMCALAEEQNARHAAEQQARDAGSGVLGYADPGAHHR